MTSQLNPARRLERIMAAVAPNTKQKTLVFDVWSTVFEVRAERGSPEAYAEVTRRLLDLLRDLDLVEEWLRGTDLSPVRYASKLEEVRRALSPARLHEGWNTISGAFRDEIRSSLIGQYGDSMGDLEQDVQGDLDTLMEQVAALEESLSESTEISPEVRRFVVAQLDAIRKAIRDYPSQGAMALEAAFRRFCWEWASAPASKTDRDRETLAKVKKLWARSRAIVATATRLLITAAAAFEAGEELLDRMPGITGAIDRIITSRPAPPQLPPSSQ